MTPENAATSGGEPEVSGSIQMAGEAAPTVAPFQVMPPLAAADLADLRADIVARGVLVPVVLDQHGRILDGHHRRAIAAELGIRAPTEVRHVRDDEDARSVALALNLARRHLTREQRRGLIADEAARTPQASDREIARRLGCSPSTVASVRRPVSNLDAAEDAPLMGADEARERTDRIKADLAAVTDLATRAVRELTRTGREVEAMEAARDFGDFLRSELGVVDEDAERFSRNLFVEISAALKAGGGS